LKFKNIKSAKNHGVKNNPAQCCLNHVQAESTPLIAEVAALTQKDLIGFIPTDDLS
jgi:hypothetical protein